MKEFGEFEEDLRQALERRPAPPGLKRKVMDRRTEEHKRRTWLGNAHFPAWMRVAAVLVLAAMVGGGSMLRSRRIAEERRGEAAKQQVFTALRITGKALNHVQERLAAHDREGE